MILELSTIVPILEQISATLWKDEPFNDRRVINRTTYLLNEEMLSNTTSVDMDDVGVSPQTIEDLEVRNLIRDILDLLGEFLDKHNVNVGVCVDMTLQNARGLIVMNFAID